MTVCRRFAAIASGLSASPTAATEPFVPKPALIGALIARTPRWPDARSPPPPPLQCLLRLRSVLLLDAATTHCYAHGTAPMPGAHG